MRRVVKPASRVHRPNQNATATSDRGQHAGRELSLGLGAFGIRKLEGAAGRHEARRSPGNAGCTGFVT